MRAALCVDNRMGFQFNGRRLSRDRVQQEDLLALCGGEPLRVAPCSAPLFSWAADRIAVEEDLLAASGGLCFLEDRLPPPEAVEELILYCWNRDYPADVRLDWDLTAFQIAEAREFPGRSHPRITRTIYVRTGRTP